MSLFQTLADLFDSIFKRSSPEVQKKQQLKKLELEIRDFQPAICKNGILQPNFGEAIYSLYKNTKPLDNIFADTVSPNDISRQHRFEAQLILTGYSPESQEIIETLSFANRKNEVISQLNAQERVYIHQKSLFERVMKELNGESFRRMDSDILALRRLVEFTRFNFVTFLQLFDTGFLAGELSYVPSYSDVQIQKAQNLLEDLYYHIADMSISVTMANEVLALAQLRKGSELTDTEQTSIMSNLKKVNFIISKILTADKLKTLIRYCKQDITYEPQKAVYTGSPKQEFAQMFHSRFEADEQRIKSEIQDETITEDLNILFHDIPLETVYNYDADHNATLQNETSYSFMWVLPLRILKTFLKVYVPDSVKSLLNDIVIEGFFNNPTYKSNFSTTVYAVINGNTEIDALENSFKTGQKNSIAIMESYIKDLKKDKDFAKKLEKMVVDINNDVHRVLQNEVNYLHSLYKELGELLADAKKPSSEIIQNLKVLMMSSRNRDNTAFLEQNYNNWKIFFEIMKNYVIINNNSEIPS